MYRFTHQRIALRPLGNQDLQDFYAYRRLPDVVRYQGLDVFSLEKCQSFIEEMKDKPFGETGNWVQIGIEWPEKGVLIGDCAVNLDAYEPRLAEIGYTIGPKFQGKGLATEAVTCLVRHLFSEKGVHKIKAIVDVRNPASSRVLEKVGFQREGHLRDSYYDEIDQAWFDEYLYGLLASDLST